MQFATATTAYLFQLHNKGAVEVVRKLLSATNVTKVGFDLRQDQTQLMRAVNASARPILDLDVVFRSKGFGRSLGIKNAVAVVFNHRFNKSKHITTSNWSSRQLEPRQLVYAANDAYVALQVFHALLASGLNEHKRGRSATAGTAGTATSRRSTSSETVRQQQRLRRHGQGHLF